MYLYLKLYFIELCDCLKLLVFSYFCQALILDILACLFLYKLPIQSTYALAVTDYKYVFAFSHHFIHFYVDVLPPTTETEPDENGIITIIEYKWKEGALKEKIKVIRRVKKFKITRKIYAAALERRVSGINFSFHLPFPS
jgi:hypothetical protein